MFENGTGSLYRLTETQAPKGYQCLAEPMYVTTPYTVEIYYAVTYTVVNSGIPYLPRLRPVRRCVYHNIPGHRLMAAAVGGTVVFFRRKKSHS